MTHPYPAPDGFPPELLAGYADGELDAATRAAVEQWLADNPEGLSELSGQHAFSRANAALWEQARPPEPSPAAWAAARRAIDDALATPPARPTRSRRAAVLVAACAAGLTGLAGAWVLTGWSFPRPGAVRPGPAEVVPVAKAPERGPAAPEPAPAPRAVTPPRTDPLAEFAVLPMATDDDVVLERVPDTGSGWLPVGRHPLPGVLVLASPEEVDLQDVDPSPAWPTGRPAMTTAPGDAPMIFALLRR